MATVNLKNVNKSYGDVKVIHDVSAAIKDREFVALVGPSGCGKSTLLRMIAGLEEISGGEIMIGDKVVNDVLPSDRGVSMVFQSYALYPHMTVRENMSFGLKVTGHDKAYVKERVDNAARILQLEPLLDRKPRALSGGQRQRVAIGRSIVRDPEVFLFDEPLSNLDAELRVQMRVELALLHRQLNATMIYVTHDQTEAMTLADQIVVLHDGIVEQMGPPMELYDRPRNEFVAGFIGSPRMNIIPVDMGAGAGWLKNAPSTVARVGVRPEHLERSKKGLQGTVHFVEHLGGQTLTHIKLMDGSSFTLSEAGAGTDNTGDQIYLSPAKGRLHMFDAAGVAVR